MEKYEFSKAQMQFFEKDEIPFAIYQLVDKKVVTLAISKGFIELFGYSDFKTAYYEMDNDMYKDAHPDDVARISNVAIAFATGKEEKYDVIYRTKFKNTKYYNIIHALGKHHILEDGTTVAQVWYISEGKYDEDNNYSSNIMNQALNTMLHQASFIQKSEYDYLTGLPNMTRFFEIAEAERDKAVNNGKNPVLIYLDIVGMKFFNSKHGFSEGNKILLAVARLLSKVFNAENCSHLGQGHFAAVSTEDACEKLLKEVFKETKGLNNGKSLPIRAGIYKNSTEDVDSPTACDRAKIACSSIGNIYESSYRMFDEEMLARVNRRQYIIDNFDKALKEKWIKVYYQPIVRAVNGRVCDEEALARWQDPERGMLSPDEFIPVLEEIKQIYKLDLYVVSEVLEKIKMQDAHGYYVVPQSVNLSRYDFEVCDIVEEIRRRVDAAEISHDRITIEITESVIGSNFDYIKSQVERFRENGFPVWLDDFGAGYSSLDTLQSIQFDLIKFDMKFMQHLNDSYNSAVVLTELIKMVSVLGIDTVCEGVETKEQVKFLQDIGCSKLQGYYFTKPLSVDAIFERYKNGTQIGFENIELTEYYDTIGRANLFDLSMVADEEYALPGVYKTMPTAIIEIKKDGIKYARSNISFRTFMQRNYKIDISDIKDSNEREVSDDEKVFLNMLTKSIKGGNRLFIDEKLPDNSIAHYFIKRVAINPLTGTIALFVAVFSVLDAEEGATYANIARALVRDYFNLFYINLETESFIEYTSKAGTDDITIERHGNNFFYNARNDALSKLYPVDRALFVKEFTKENILKALNEQGTFTLTYRLLIDDSPVYVNMKAMMMSQNDKYIIIGVSSVDLQMKQKEALDRIKQDQSTYLRIKALSGNYVCIYTIDPKTNEYVESNSNSDYANLEISRKGDDFFITSYHLAPNVVYKDDLEYYYTNFSKEIVMDQIAKQGYYLLSYRLVLKGKPTYVDLKAVLVDEEEGQKLLIGVLEK